MRSRCYNGSGYNGHDRQPGPARSEGRGRPGEVNHVANPTNLCRGRSYPGHSFNCLSGNNAVAGVQQSHATYQRKAYLRRPMEGIVMSEDQAEYTRLCGPSLGDYDIDYTGEVEMLCFRYWRLLPEPKPEYTKWFYTKRKSMVAKLFTPEKE